MYSAILSELENAFAHVSKGNYMLADLKLTREINKLKTIQKQNKVKMVRHLKKHKLVDGPRQKEYLVQDELRDLAFGGVICNGMSPEERQRAERYQRSKKRGTVYIL